MGKLRLIVPFYKWRSCINRMLGIVITINHVPACKIGNQKHLFHCKKYLSRVMRNPTFCICENKDADQLRGNREAGQRLCFRNIDSAISLLSESKISSHSHLLWLYSLDCVGPGRKPRGMVFSQRGSYFFDDDHRLVKLCFKWAASSEKLRFAYMRKQRHRSARSLISAFFATKLINPFTS